MIKLPLGQVIRFIRLLSLSVGILTEDFCKLLFNLVFEAGLLNEVIQNVVGQMKEVLTGFIIGGSFRSYQSFGF